MQKQTVKEATIHLSVVVPTYLREEVLLNTIHLLLNLEDPPDEILIIDQTPEHNPKTEGELALLEGKGKIRWIRLPEPTITHAMNIGLEEARHDIVLFLDDDIFPGRRLISAHRQAHLEDGINIVAGQVLQLGEEPSACSEMNGLFRFTSSCRKLVTELMGGNFSVKRKTAIALGGFDENFVHVAYRFEAEFAERALLSGEKILFEPEAGIRHLRAESGGTRSYGVHFRTIKPSHAVGEYYYVMRSKTVRHQTIKMITRFFVSVKTRHHLRKPWWIPVTLVAELWGFLWALLLSLRGPRLMGWEKNK
jgi:GT2 family glycosyltransferase